MSSSCDGASRRCESCECDVHDLRVQREDELVARAVLRGERSLCVRLAPFAIAAIGAAVSACSASPDVASPGTEELASRGSRVTTSRRDDADQDGIANADDACPDTPGNPDADPRKNGCPRIVVVESMGMTILPSIYFKRSDATLQSESAPLLEAGAKVLQSHPEIKSIEIEGHAATDDARPQAMSEARALGVKQTLVSLGVEDSRITIKGYGATRPIAEGTSDEDRARNRTVRFRITEQTDAK